MNCLVIGRAHRLEDLGQRLAGAGEGDGVVVDDGFADGFRHGLLEDECGADHVLVGQRGSVGRCADVVPDAGRGDVEGLHQLGQGVVAVLAELGRVLDLHQGDNIGAGLGDGGDDLVLLALEVLRVGSAAGVAAAADRDGVAVAVRVVGAAGEGVPCGGEVVQHVEGGDLQVAAHGRRSLGAGGAEAGRLDGGLVGLGQVGQRLELPGVVGVAEHHVGL